MIVTFNYAEQGVMDPRPILLFLHQDNKTKNIEGLNLNYLNPTKLKKLFQVIDFKKTKRFIVMLYRLINFSKKHIEPIR